MANIFEKMTPREIEKLLDIFGAHTLKFPKNKNISMSVKDLDTLSIVTIGLVQITRTDELGNSVVVEEIGENEVFGTLLSNIINPEYEVITKEETTIITIDYKRVISEDIKTSYYSQFIKNILAIYLNKIKQINERIDILTNKTTRDKLLAYFKILSKGNTLKTIYLPFSYSDLADYLGVNRSAMTRELSYLKEEGLIETSGRKIKLHYYIN